MISVDSIFFNEFSVYYKSESISKKYMLKNVLIQ